MLYALSSEPVKKQRAWQILFTHPCISTQVLSECSNTLIRKHNLDKSHIRGTLRDILQFVSVEPVELPTVEQAWKVMERYRFGYFDSLILATALVADCQILYSEDFQDGQVIDDRLTIINPFSTE